MSSVVYTIGHSNHTLGHLATMLNGHGITAVADVRSQPYSRVNPQFNREKLQQSLTDTRISYVFLGCELGARSTDPACYFEGRVQYDRLAKTELFRRGLDRVEEGVRKHRIALLCAEKEPLDCHRTILVSRYLRLRGVVVRHILEDGTVEDHDAAIERLMRLLRIPNVNCFKSPQDRLAVAYEIQGAKIAYKVPDDSARRFESGVLFP